MIKPCSVIYFPGTGGNFFAFCLSLSQETVPYCYFDLHNLNNDEILKIQSMTAQDRQQVVSIDNLQNFQKVHSPDIIFDPDFYYQNTLINNHFEWTISRNHLDNYQDKLPWLKKTFYLELDWQKHGHWVKNAASYFRQYSYITNFTINDHKTYFLSTEQEKQVHMLKSYSFNTTISMSKILEGTNGFLEQYLLACSKLNLTPEINNAIKLYQDWYKFRVEPFL